MAFVPNKSAEITADLCSHLSAQRWDAFVSGAPDGSVFHKFGWKQIFERAYGNECVYLMAEEDGATVGVLPLVFKKSFFFGRFLVSLPYFDHVGICCKTDDVRRILLLRAQELARERKATHIELRHNREVGFGLRTKQSKVVMVLQIPSDPDKLWSSLKAKVRNQVRKAEKEGLSLSEGKSELLNCFFGVYAANMRDLGSPSHCKKFFGEICETFPESVRIFCVKDSAATIAAGFTIASKKMLTIPWASSLRKSNSKCPNMLLYWSVLKYACESGFEQFSFGRSTPDEGTYQFKKQWGAEAKPLYWQYWLPNGGEVPELNMENSKYSLPIKIWKSMPVAVTKTLGPRLIQNLP